MGGRWDIRLIHAGNKWICHHIDDDVDDADDAEWKMGQWRRKSRCHALIMGPINLTRGWLIEVSYRADRWYWKGNVGDWGRARAHTHTHTKIQKNLKLFTTHFTQSAHKGRVITAVPTMTSFWHRWRWIFNRKCFEDLTEKRTWHKEPPRKI